MAVQYAPTKLRVPPGFQNILEGFAREVLREQPQDIIQFGAQYFKAQLAIRDETGKDDAKRGENLEKLQKGEDVDIDLDDPQVQAAATKIQAGFRGHKAREEVKHKKEEEAAALKIQSSFRGHKAREQVQELKESRSRESTEASPMKEPEKPAEDEVDIDLNDPEVQGAALKIQASFRGHKARTEVQKMKSSEAVAAEVKDEVQKEEGEVAAAEQPSESAPKDEEIDIDLNDPQVEKAATVIQSSFRAHKSRESVKALTEKEDSEEPKEDTVDKGEESAAAAAAAATAGEEDTLAADKKEEIDIDLSDPEVNKAATKIQASFRGHQTRKELKDKSPTTSHESVKVAEVSAVDDVAPETASEQQPEPEAESEPQEAADTQETPAGTEDKVDVAPESGEAAPGTEDPQEETKVEEQEAEPTPETQESTPQADDTDKPAPEDAQAEDQAES